MELVPDHPRPGAASTRERALDAQRPKESAPPQWTGERPRTSKPCSLLRLALEIDVANRWVASAPATSASGTLHNRDRA